MSNESNKQTKTAKRSLFVNDPSRSDRDRRARILYVQTETGPDRRSRSVIFVCPSRPVWTVVGPDHRATMAS